MAAHDPADDVDYDPRDWVTESAFRVRADLLGLPLAKPWRRALALVLDLIAIAVLAAAPALLFGIAAAALLLRASARPAAMGLIGRSTLFLTRVVAALVTFVVVINLWQRVDGGGAPPPRPSDPAVPSMGAISGLSMGAGVLALTRADDEAEARRYAEEIARAMQEAGVSSEVASEMLANLPRNSNRPWVGAALDSVRTRLEVDAAARARQATRTEDEVREAYLVAMESGDADAISRTRADLGAALAHDTIASLERTVLQQSARVDALQERVGELQGRGAIIAAFHRFREDIGLGFSWSALYFTAFTVLWQGRTPGKRLLRLRVVRLDGKRLGWWGAFERFAGYAAGLATGLLGFIQIFWDRNRQAIHDKISSTVVLQE